LAAPVVALAAEQGSPARPAFIALGDFTINIPGNGDQLSYVVISVTIEAAPEAATDLRALEPRLKETVMRRLMTMADRGVLQPGHTDPLVVKQSLLTSLTELQPGGVRDVLIIRLLYG
jgi:hypothetical protein